MEIATEDPGAASRRDLFDVTQKLRAILGTAREALATMDGALQFATDVENADDSRS